MGSFTNSGDYPDQPTPPARRRVQDRVHEMVRYWQQVGVTQAEVSLRLGLGHGSASGALTRLHRADKIARLATKRDGQYVYVLPEHVHGRPLSAYTPLKGTGTNIVVTRQQVYETARDMFYASDPESVLAQRLGQWGVVVDG